MTKKDLESSLARMRELAGHQAPKAPEPELITDAGQVARDMDRLVIEDSGKRSEVTGKLKISKIEKDSLVRMTRRGSFRPDDPMKIASCELLVTYGYATRHNGEYRVTAAGRSAARQSKFSMRFGQ